MLMTRLHQSVYKLTEEIESPIFIFPLIPPESFNDDDEIRKSFTDRTGLDSLSTNFTGSAGPCDVSVVFLYSHWRTTNLRQYVVKTSLALDLLITRERLIFNPISHFVCIMDLTNDEINYLNLPPEQGWVSDLPMERNSLIFRNAIILTFFNIVQLKDIFNL